MDSQRLIDFITELVVRELQSQPPPVAAPPPAEVQARGVLVVCGDGDRRMEDLPAQLKALPQVTVVPSPVWPAERLSALFGSTPTVSIASRHPGNWSAAVRESQAVVLPNATLPSFVELALLLGREPCVAAAVHALIENRPVFAAAEEVNFLLRHAAHLQKPFLGVLRGHVSTVQSLGVRCVEMGALGSEVGRALQTPSRNGPSGRGRDVLTREDVEAMLRSGLTRIEVASGTIVTPLALEVAAAKGVPIEFR